MALPLEELCTRYSVSDVRLATQNFHEEMIVGRGGFGAVYKGCIKNENGSNTVVAIKRLDSMSNQGEPEFKAELDTLSQLRHSHLVSLVGCCVDENEKIIIYEYMPRGTLDHHLHKSNTPLSWKQRLMISIGTARGLDYLHTGAYTNHAVVHRDLKSSNILLDNDWEAKISDFGLAKVCPTNQSTTHVNVNVNVSASVKGTYGYLDPNFQRTGKLHSSTDVFAFGVILFELLSRKRAVFSHGDEDLSLAKWAQNHVERKHFDQLVAPEIRGQLCPTSLKAYARIAYDCLHDDPKKRPPMHMVLAALHRSLTLQEKFDNRAKRARLFRFIWKIKCFGLPTNETFVPTADDDYETAMLLDNRRVHDDG